MGSRLSPAEEVFVNIFTTLYGEQHRSYLLKYHNLPFIDTHGSQRFMDFALFLLDKKIAIEIEGEAYHNPALIEASKYSDDLIRANAQIIAGWVRLSFTPRTLFESVETVKKQLHAVLGDAPILVESTTSAPLSSLMTTLPPWLPLPKLEGIIQQRVEDVFQSPVIKDFALSKMRPAMKSAFPTASELLDYSIGRNVPYLADVSNEVRFSRRKETLSNFDRLHPDVLNDVLRPIADTFKLFNIQTLETLEAWYGAIKGCLTPITTSREAAFGYLEQFIRGLYDANLNLRDDVLHMRHTFSQDKVVLRYLTSQLATTMSAISAAYLPQRQALIAIRDGRACKVLLNRKQIDVASNGFEFPNNFYESCIDEILGFNVIPVPVLNRLLMGDSSFNATPDEASSLPAAAHELTGHLQDTVYLCFNHGLINRYYVETEPCEFVINAYNIKTITIYEQPANNGIILLWFKVKYTDESVELGMTILDPGHKEKCHDEACAIKKYDLQFYVEYSSNKNVSVSNPQKFINAARNMGKIMPLIAACYRDLNVLEVETRSYTKSRKQVLKPLTDNRKKEYWTKVVWVPRKKVYYDRARLDQTSPQFKKAIEELVPTMIMGHLRRCENPNPKQLELAREFGIMPPVGYTFVRPHSRHVHKAELTRFRSKSALEILYGQAG
jgi:hypothetical protein